MINKRPKNLNLITIRFPLPAIVSILHRVSGLALFFLLPIFLWLFSYSLLSEQNFNTIQTFLSSPWMKFIIWVLLAPLCYHFVAGIRHLLMDMHVGETLKSGRMLARFTMIASIVLIILVGVWLW